LTDLPTILAQALPIRWQAPWLLPAVLGLGAAVAAAVLWFYPPQVRAVRRPWRYVIPGLRLVAFTVLAVMVAKPVALRARPAEGRGVLLVLLDRSRSMSVADRGRRPAELVALADSLGLLKGRRAAGTSGVAADFERVQAAAAQAVRAQGDLDYARVSGRGVEAAEARVRAQVDDLREQARALATSPAAAAANPALRAKLAPLAGLQPADLRGAWAAEARKRLDAAADAVAALCDQVDRRLFDADPDVRAICGEVERRTRFELAAEALVRPGTGLLAKLGPDTQAMVFGFAGDVTPLGVLRPADPAAAAPPVGGDASPGPGGSPTPDGDESPRPAAVVAWSAHTRIGIEPDGGATDLSGAVAAAVAAADGKPIRGVLVLSDGQSAGVEGARATAGPAALPPGVPLIAAAAAGPAAPKDLAVVDLSAPASAFVGETVTVRARVRATGGAVADPSALRLAVVGPTGTAGSPGAAGDAADLAPTSTDKAAGRPAEPTAAAQFAVRFDRPGVHEVRVTAPSADGEATAENNVARRWVKVLPDRVRVLVVAGTPGWDFQYLRAALARQPWFAVESVILDPAAVAAAAADPKAGGADPKAAKPAGPSPVPTAADILAQDVLVLYDVPAGGLSGEQWAAADRLVTQRGGGVVVVAGPAFNPGAFADHPGAALLPFNLSADRKPAARVARADKPPGKLVPSPEYARSDVLRLDDADAANRRWQDLAGVWRVLPVRAARPGVRTLLRDADSGLAAATEFRPGGGPGRAVYVGTTETWRWRHKGGAAEHERFWRQLVRFAADDPYAATVGRLALDLDKVAVAAGQAVQVRARVLGPDEVRSAGGPPPTAESLVVEVVAADGGGGQVVLTARLTEAADGSGRLRATVADLPVGRYRVRLVAAGGKSATPSPPASLPATGPAQPDWPELPLVVEAGGEAEMRNLAGDADRLKRMADGTGGRLLRLDQLAAVPGLLAAAADDRPRVVEWPLWDSPWLFAFVVGCLGAEWGLRKRAGLA
jgi:hypothetical protein